MARRRAARPRNYNRIPTIPAMWVHMIALDQDAADVPSPIMSARGCAPVSEHARMSAIRSRHIDWPPRAERHPRTFIRCAAMLMRVSVRRRASGLRPLRYTRRRISARGCMNGGTTGMILLPPSFAASPSLVAEYAWGRSAMAAGPIVQTSQGADRTRPSPCTGKMPLRKKMARSGAYRTKSGFSV